MKAIILLIFLALVAFSQTTQQHTDTVAESHLSKITGLRTAYHQSAPKRQQSVEPVHVKAVEIVKPKTQKTQVQEQQKKAKPTPVNNVISVQSRSSHQLHGGAQVLEKSHTMQTETSTESKPQTHQIAHTKKLRTEEQPAETETTQTSKAKQEIKGQLRKEQVQTEHAKRHEAAHQSQVQTHQSISTDVVNVNAPGVKAEHSHQQAAVEAPRQDQTHRDKQTNPMIAEYPNLADFKVRNHLAKEPVPEHFP